MREKQLVGWIKHAQIWGVYTNTGTDERTPNAGFLMRPRPASPQLTRQTCTRRAGVTCAARARPPAGLRPPTIMIDIRSVGPGPPAARLGLRLKPPAPTPADSWGHCHWLGYRATGRVIGPLAHSMRRATTRTRRHASGPHAGTQPGRRRGPAQPACGPGSTVQLPTSGSARRP